ncbi:polysaccharide biosynthesis protein [Haladaptatus paucihalophilus DX253]|uniref:Membrane protein involved in the export of O-antigen and teichoic acid n=1 Tax=Haladaptatus paucihalophilus DX253 TaxID=797209 RepID=E7QYX9_HALPU|nr:polysaccharide biosynthesis C-terminal domain-containing protein [Haladaptatus paucihalophilus]EFW90395.1 polysaccharide biosynthesis protein [Haladaptatus paucihalophilus DX253]SHK03276.1 Membrane protein involved in the export of O-antigen and teichoic acid [Haladaptatus paucihalophilus DX253]
MTDDASNVSLGGETVKGSIAKASMAAIGFIGTVIFAQKLGATLFGKYHLLLSLVLLTERPISGGWTSAATKRASEIKFSNREVIGAQLLVGIVWILALGGIAIIAGDWLRRYTGVEAAVPLFLLLLSAKVLYSCFVPIIQAQGHIGTAVGIDALRSYFTFPLQLILVIVGFGVAGMVSGLAGATLLVIPVALYYHQTLPTKPSVELLRSLWEYARYSIPTSMLWKTYDRFDVLLLGALMTPAAVGDYEVAAKLTFPAMFVAEISGSGLMVRVSNLRSKGESAVRDISNVISFSSILSIPLFFGALVVARPLVIKLYGSEYASASILLIGLSLYRILTTQTVPLYKAINGFDMPDSNFRISSITLVVNLILGVVLTIELGAVGVVIATVVSEAVRYLGLAFLVRSEMSRVVLLPRELLEQFLAGAIMFGVVSFSRPILGTDSWIRLGTLLMTGVVVYGVCLLVMSRKLRLTIGSVLRGSRIEQMVPKWMLNW